MAVTNKDFHAASRNRKDEFYTQLTDIEKEMRYYRDFFQRKAVLYFFKYFAMNFSSFGLKKLIGSQIHKRFSGPYKATHTGGSRVGMGIGWCHGVLPAGAERPHGRNKKGQHEQVVHCYPWYTCYL